MDMYGLPLNVLAGMNGSFGIGKRLITAFKLPDYHENSYRVFTLFAIK